MQCQLPDDYTPFTRLSESAQRTIAMSPFSSVMNYLSAVMASPLQRYTAQMIEGLGIEIPMRLGALPGTERGRYTPPSTLPGRRVDVGITIDPSKASLQTVLHEGTHAATTTLLRYPQTEEQRAAGQRIRELFNYVEQQPGANQWLGMKQVEEFVAEAFTNPRFQQFLHSIELPDAPRVTAWTAFKQFVMELLGHPSVLSEVLIHGEKLMSKEQRAGAALSQKGEVKSPIPQRVPRTALSGAKGDQRVFIAYNPDGQGKKYTLYAIKPGGDPRGDKSTKVSNLTRQDAEEYMRQRGAEVIAPAADTQLQAGTPKNTETVKVGFDKDGNLKTAAYQQKDGTWTYYESDEDVRSDPDARVVKGLSEDAVQRYISAKGYRPDPPKPGAVKPNAEDPTAVGYDPVGMFRYNWQDMLAPVKAIGMGQNKLKQRPSENVEVRANLRNSRVQNVYSRARETYVIPAKEAGEKVAKQWSKTQDQIEKTLQLKHTIERMQKKIQQTLRGKDDPATQHERNTDYRKKLDKAQAELTAQRSANPGYVQSVEQEFAPKMKAMTDGITDMAAQYGLISRRQAEQMKAAYDYYVPLQHGEKTTTGKIATGANVTTDRSFARVVEQLQRTINRGENNRITDSVAQVIEKYGVINNDDGQPVGTVGMGTKVRYDEDTESLSETVDSHTFDPNTVFFYRNGDRIPMTLTDPVLLKALAPYKGVERGGPIAAAMAVSSWINRMVAVGKTSANFAFPFGNIQRDIQSANINMPEGVSRIKFLSNLNDTELAGEVSKNVLGELFGRAPTGLYGQAKHDGAMISHRDYVNLGVIANDLDTIFRPSRSLKGINALRKKAQSKSFEALSLVAQISESIPRFAMYKAAIDSFMQGKPDTPENRKEARLFAANAAKKASVNFEQRGAYNLSSWWMFGNAKIQGLTALGQSMNRMGATKATLGLLGITMLGYLVASAQQDGEKDKDGKPKSVKVQDYIKDSKVFLNEGGPAMSLSQEITPFYIFGHAMSEFARGNTDGAHTASRIFTGILNNLWPGNVPQQEVTGHKAEPMNFLLQSLLPTGIVPLQQLASNKNVWGEDIVSKKAERTAQGIPLSEMGSANENQLAVNVARGLYSVTGGTVDMAPQQLKMLHNYFDPLTEPYAFLRDIAGLREPKYPGDVVNPIERRLTAHSTPFYDQNQFDELLAQSTRAKLKAEGKPGVMTGVGIAALSPEDQALAASAKMLANIKSDIGNMFHNAQLLTKEQRDALNERARERMLEGIRRYNELRDRTVRAK